MRYWRDVADDGEIESDRLKRAHRRFTTRARSPNEDFDFFQAMTHRLTRGGLGHHLRRISGAFTRAFESDFPRARPANHIALQIGDGDDRVVKRGKDVGETRVNILASFGLDDLGLFDVVGIKGKILLRRFGGGSFGLLRQFLRGLWFGLDLRRRRDSRALALDRSG